MTQKQFLKEIDKLLDYWWNLSPHNLTEINRRIVHEELLELIEEYEK